MRIEGGKYFIRENEFNKGQIDEAVRSLKGIEKTIINKNKGKIKKKEKQNSLKLAYAFTAIPLLLASAPFGPIAVICALGAITLLGTTAHLINMRYINKLCRPEIEEIEALRSLEKWKNIDWTTKEGLNLSESLIKRIEKLVVEQINENEDNLLRRDY